MPRKITFVSSISGKEVEEDQAWSIRFSGPGDDDYFEADATTEEAQKLIKEVKAEKRAKRGRKPGSESNAEEKAEDKGKED